MAPRLFAALLLAAIPTLACECRPSSFCRLAASPVVFVGQVVSGGIDSLRQDPWRSGPTTVRFRVVDNWRGLAAGATMVDVEMSPMGDGMCVPIPYFGGRTYVVAPRVRFDDGRLGEMACFSGIDVESAPDLLRELRAWFAAGEPRQIRGRIGISQGGELDSELLKLFGAQVLAGATVSAERNGRTYTATTAADGSYSLRVPAAGDYRMSASLPPYSPPSPRSVSVPEGGCAEYTNGLKIDNTISGRAWNDRGQPLTGATLGLVGLDHPVTGDDRPAWGYEATSSSRDGRYEFTNVPPGRYRVVLNPTGPEEGKPFEPSWSPRVLNITSRGLHVTGVDLVVGARASFRRLTVRARFTDGKPYQHAAVYCVAAPRHADDLYWRRRQVAREKSNGVVEFQVPANRRLTITLRDWYGRKLNSDYTATIEPAATPVTHSFVVKPSTASYAVPNHRAQR